MATNIGTGPQDIPLNQFLGEMAYMDRPPTHPFLEANLTIDITNYDGRQLNNTEVIYNNVLIDTVGGYNTANGKYTVPDRGIYYCIASTYSNVNTFSQSWWLVNGSRVSGSDWVREPAAQFVQGTTVLYVNSGDTIGFKIYNNSNPNTIRQSANHSWMKITKIS